MKFARLKQMVGAFGIVFSLMLALPASADDEGRIIQDSIQADPQAEMKAPSAIVKNADASPGAPLIITVNGRQFEIPAVDAVEESLRGHYEKLPPDYQQMFQTNRVIFLTRAAQLLSTSFMSNMFGTGALVKDSVRWTYDHLREAMRPHSYGYLNHPQTGFFRDRSLTPEQAAEVVAQAERDRTLWGMKPDDERVVLKNIQERRHEVIQRILLNLDRNFWSRPALVANSNEVGAFASIGVTAFAGAQFKDQKRGFGGSLDIGIFIGWNKTESSAVIQIFRTTEAFRGTMTALTANAAVVPKWGMMFSNMMKGRETQAERGVVYYPPTPPGVSSFFMSSPNRFAAGMNPPIGLIPWPFDAILLYSMDYVMKPMLRISFRFEVLKEFIKVDTGPKGEGLKAVKTSVKRSALWVQSKASGRKMCVGAHGM